jgi:hypothetical protein
MVVTSTQGGFEELFFDQNIDRGDETAVRYKVGADCFNGCDPSMLKAMVISVVGRTDTAGYQEYHVVGWKRAHEKRTKTPTTFFVTVGGLTAKHLPS